MGAWGTGLYQDDTTSDIKDEYLTYLKIGMTNEEALRKIIEENECYIEDEEDGPLFWFALADTLWKYGRLTEEVKKEAIKQIEEGKDLERWKEDKKLYEKRKKVLEELRQKLETEQPKEKKISKMTFLRSPWEVGDIIAYQILNENLKDHRWYKKYVILKVVSLHRMYIGSLPRDIYYHEEPMINLYNWIGDEIPNIEVMKKIKPIFIIAYQNELDGRVEQIVSTVYFTKRELRKLNVKVLENKKEDIKESQTHNKRERITSFNAINFEPELLIALEREEALGNLIKDI